MPSILHLPLFYSRFIWSLFPMIALLFSFYTKAQRQKKSTNQPKLTLVNYLKTDINFTAYVH